MMSLFFALSLLKLLVLCGDVVVGNFQRVGIIW